MPNAGALPTHFARHRIATGHDWLQSGNSACGQHGMLSIVPAMPKVATGAAARAEAEGAAIEIKTKPRIDRTEAN